MSHLRWTLSGKNTHSGPFAEYVTALEAADVGAAEAQLSEYAFRRAIEHAVRAGIAACDVDGRQTYVNAAFCEMVGWSEAELVGARPPFRYWPAENRARIEKSFRKMLAGETPHNGFELQFCCSDGRRIDVVIESAPLVSGDGLLQGWLASITDVSDRKRTEAALRASEQERALLAEAACAGTWEWDLLTNQVCWSDNLEAIHGMPAGSFGHDFASFLVDVRPDHRERVQKIIFAALDSRSAFRMEYPLVPKNGHAIWMESRGRVICDRSGRPVKMAGICIDISDRKAAQSEVQRLKARMY